MQLNTLSPAPGSKPAKRRVGRGIGSGSGKTCGRGHKGQHARSGGYHKVGFEGGQMPLQRRIPKSGFTSRVGRFVDEVTLSEINKLPVDIIDIEALKAAKLIRNDMLSVKVIASGEITRAVTINNLKVTKGARELIEKAGGKIV